jgi:hypothetical protein
METYPFNRDYHSPFRQLFPPSSEGRETTLSQKETFFLITNRPMTMQHITDHPGPQACYNCGGPDHWTQDCPEPRRPVRSLIAIFGFIAMGHLNYISVLSYWLWKHVIDVLLVMFGFTGFFGMGCIIALIASTSCKHKR